MTTYGCGNCGHPIETTDDLAAMGFKWLDPEQTTSRCSCPACQATTIQRVTGYDETGRPCAGEFLTIRTFNTIRRTRPNDRTDRTTH